MRTHYLLPVLLLGCLLGCRKDFLEKKSDKALLVPVTLADFQALLDNSAVMNITPEIQLIASDDVYTTDAGLQAYYTTNERSSYTWEKDIYEGNFAPDWEAPYVQVFYANIVLAGLDKMTVSSSDREEFNRVKGSALFFRGHAFYQLAQLFAQPYQAATAQLPGIPLPLTPDVNARPGRGTVQATYQQIISDLGAAAELLPAQVNYKSRPCKAAALALLARVYLAMADYEQALKYADESLRLNNKLLDYNTLTTTAAKPFPAALPNGNDEVLFYTAFVSYSFELSTLSMPDSGLYRSYTANDLRKLLFFRDRGNGIINFKGSYGGSATASFFSGITTDEMYLVRAECAARAGNVTAAMADLNALLLTRFKKGTFVAYNAADRADALAKILAERRKELLFRGLRWTDLRRLNREPAFATTLTRKINGQVYTLPPNDLRYVFTLPPHEMAAGGKEQNPR